MYDSFSFLLLIRVHMLANFNLSTFIGCTSRWPTILKLVRRLDGRVRFVLNRFFQVTSFILLNIFFYKNKMGYFKFILYLIWIIMVCFYNVQAKLKIWNGHVNKVIKSKVKLQLNFLKYFIFGIIIGKILQFKFKK